MIGVDLPLVLPVFVGGGRLPAAMTVSLTSMIRSLPGLLASLSGLPIGLPVPDPLPPPSPSSDARGLGVGTLKPSGFTRDLSLFVSPLNFVPELDFESDDTLGDTDLASFGLILSRESGLGGVKTVDESQRPLSLETVRSLGMERSLGMLRSRPTSHNSFSPMEPDLRLSRDRGPGEEKDGDVWGGVVWAGDGVEEGGKEILANDGLCACSTLDNF